MTLPMLSLLALVAIFCAVWPAGVCAQDGVLVLRNGEVLHGRITRLGDRYLVTFDQRSELRVAADQVEMQCCDLDEAYRRKRAAIRTRSIDRHLSLADWCLRHSLTARAADEILAANAIDARDPRLAPLERRLQLAVGGTSTHVSQAVRKTTIVGLDELERTMRSLPDDAVEDFTVNVQPLLLNRCATNSCHGMGAENDFHLFRPPLGRSLARRLTQRNLHAALQFIDPSSPATSPLVALPSGLHGGMASPLFEEADRRQVQQLVQWLKRVAEPRLGPAPAHISPQKPALLQTDGDSRPIDHNLPSSMNIRQVDFQSPIDSLERPRRIMTDYQPRDPFDPEVFNRRYFFGDNRDE